MAIALWVEPGEQSAGPGGTATFTVRAANQGAIVDRIGFEVLGPAAAWAVLEPAEVSLFPGGDGGVTLSLSPPLGTAAGPVPFGVRATGASSGDVEVGEATLLVGASRSVEAELRPRTATGTRRATSVVVLHNTGNAATTVEVVASDPDDAIVFDAPSAVEVRPGATAEVPLRMRLPARPKQGSTLPYSVLVQGEDTGQALDGQVRQPPRKRWPIVAALLLLGLAAAAFLMLRPEDSVAVPPGSPDGPGGSTTTLLGGEPTTLLGGTPPPSATGETTAPSVGTVPGGGTTTVSAGPSTSNPGSTGTGPRPTTTTIFVPPLPCPARGNAVDTAQRVICAWELRRLGDAADSSTPDSNTALGRITPVGSGANGQTVESSSTDAGGTTVFFQRCGNARGVRSVRVPSTGANAGRVLTVTACPAFPLSG